MTLAGWILASIVFIAVLAVVMVVVVAWLMLRPLERDDARDRNFWQAPDSADLLRPRKELLREPIVPAGDQADLRRPGRFLPNLETVGASRFGDAHRPSPLREDTQ